MKYFKYIIILTLLLICVLLYTQLNDYENISNSLLTDNIQTKEQMKKLSNSLEDIKEHSLELQQKINSLYSIIDAKEIEIELLEDDCIKNEIVCNDEEAVSTDNTSENPQKDSEITLVNENEVTGFE